MRIGRTACGESTGSLTSINEDLTRLDFAAAGRVRTEGTRNLVDAAKAAGVRRMVTQSFRGVHVPGEGLADEETALYVDAPEPWNGVARPVAISWRAGFIGR